MSKLLIGMLLGPQGLLVMRDDIFLYFFLTVAFIIKESLLGNKIFLKDLF